MFKEGVVLQDSMHIRLGFYSLPMFDYSGIGRCTVGLRRIIIGPYVCVALKSGHARWFWFWSCESPWKCIELKVQRLGSSGGSPVAFWSDHHGFESCLCHFLLTFRLGYVSHSHSHSHSRTYGKSLISDKLCFFRRMPHMRSSFRNMQKCPWTEAFR